MAMATPAKERQQKSRRRRERSTISPDVLEKDRSEGERQVALWLRTSAYVALKGIAQPDGVPMGVVVERLVLAAC
jgi:hypothetical protein